MSLEDSLKKRPTQREIFIRGSRSSNWTSSFLKQSVRSSTDFKSSSLLGGGVEAVVLEIFVFSVFMFSTI
ncbi:hypothetical protein D5R83_07265 [Helicobacter pylori]|nr:hypothetical protein BXP08_07260 [Helicobacter pylori]QDW69452.1 hypothetical protein D5R83_07265 [Helicobacter pylori]QDY54145.1 hypothetical protein CV723_07285 [Helicobacter pylori]